MFMDALLPGLQHTKAASTGHKECQVGGTPHSPPSSARHAAMPASVDASHRAMHKNQHSSSP